MFVWVHKTFVFERLATEVDKKPHTDTGSLEIVDHLGFLRSGERGERFYLNQHSVEADEIGLIGLV